METQLHRQLMELSYTEHRAKRTPGQPTYTLDLEQFANAIDEAFAYGLIYALDAVSNAGYEDAKRERIRKHIDHGGACLNDILQKYLRETPEVLQTLNQMRVIEE